MSPLKTASFHGTQESHITARDGTRIQTAALDNQGSVSGSLQVHFTGDASQFKNIGQVNARGGNFHYQGPVQQDDSVKMLPTADELADGCGDWGHVAQARAISLDADTSDVHLREPHTMPHALAVKTQGNIQCGETLTTRQSIAFQAQGAVDLKNVKAAHDVHVAGATINAQSTMERTIDGKNYHETVIPVHIQAGNAVHLHAAQNVTFKAVETSYGAGGTRLIAGGTLTDQALQTTHHTETNNAHETTRNISSTAEVSHHTSTGRFIAQCGGNYAADAPVFDAPCVAIKAQTVHILRGVSTSASSHASTTSNMFWHSEKSGAEEHQNFSALPPAGTFKIDAQEINIQQV